MGFTWSPSSRRAWIEITHRSRSGRPDCVALLEEGVDRNDDELEARLVKEGVAKYIGELGETAEQPAPAPGDDADEPASTNTAADEAPEYNEDMKLDELKEVATRYGVDASAMRKKADVIAAIEATKAEQPDDGADDEEPPQIGAADPV